MFLLIFCWFEPLCSYLDLILLFLFLINIIKKWWSPMFLDFNYSEAGIVLSLFSIFGDFEPRCFYKIVKKRGYFLLIWKIFILTFKREAEWLLVFGFIVEVMVLPDRATSLTLNDGVRSSRILKVPDDRNVLLENVLQGFRNHACDWEFHVEN